MSRSRKRTPVFGALVPVRASEKLDKRRANRRFRRLLRVKVAKQQEALPVLREVADVWDFLKDGKHYRHSPDERAMRK